MQASENLSLIISGLDSAQLRYGGPLLCTNKSVAYQDCQVASGGLHEYSIGATRCITTKGTGRLELERYNADL
jgi:hypothetical protein